MGISEWRKSKHCCLSYSISVCIYIIYLCIYISIYHLVYMYLSSVCLPIYLHIYFSLLRLLQQNIINWGLQQQAFLIVLEAGQSKVKAESFSGEISSSLQTATFLLCPHMAKKAVVSLPLLVTNINPVMAASPSWPLLKRTTSQWPHFQMPSCWRQGLQHLTFLGGRQTQKFSVKFYLSIHPIYHYVSVYPSILMYRTVTRWLINHFPTYFSLPF